MKSKLTIGIIGAGRIGQVHTISIMNNMKNVSIKWISDVVPGLAENWSKESGIANFTTDYTEVINDPEVDAILICSSTESHAKISIDAAAAKKHIFCEKPVALSIEKVKAVDDAIKQAGVKFQVGFNRRFDHNFKKISQLIKEGVLGDLHILRITSRDPEPPNPAYIEVSGGMFMDMTIHDFDMARFLSESEAEEIYVTAACLVDPEIGKAGDYDTAIITIRFMNGSLCVIDNSRKAVYGYDQRVEAFGSLGKAEAFNDLPNSAIWSTASGVFTEKPKYFFLERYMESFTEEIRQFVDAVLNDKETPVGINDGLQPLIMGLAAKKSVLEHRPVKISEFI